METNVKKALGALTGTALALSGGAGLALADSIGLPADASGTPQAAVEQADASVRTPMRVSLSSVLGTFHATQSETTPLEQVIRTFGEGSYNICSDVMREQDAVAGPAEDIMDWQIEIAGDVERPFAITMQEVADAGSVTSVMGCSCAGNPAAGMASINAEVTGPSIAALVQCAVPEAGANALTFVSADGSQTSVPLWYVFTRPALVAYQIDGEALSDTLGAVNQVWLGSTSANYFTRDVVQIRVETLEGEPAVPGEGVEYASVPNVGVLQATQA